MSNFIQGEFTTFYVSFLDSGTAPITGGISGTTIDVYHFDSSVKTDDIVSGTMTQQTTPLENTWYYEYQVPTNALPTNYNVIYTALFSGDTIQTTETYNVLPASSSFPSPIGQGSVEASGNVIGLSGISLFGVSVQAISGSTTFASTTTDVSGNYTMFLNPGQYLLSFFEEDYYPTQEAFTIPSGTSWNLGTTQLQIATQGTLVISDTYVYQNQNLDIIPIPNLKVSLFEDDMAAGASPIGIAYTNASGTFVMNADQGTYILAVQGEFWNTNTNKNDRYNYTYDIEVNSVWSGTGNTSPTNFQYLSTSKYNYIG